MKLALVVAVLVLLPNIPAFILAFDDSHSVAMENEHGVHHLILFHSYPDVADLASISLRSAEENHEFHLSTSSALVQKKHHPSAAVDMEISAKPYPFMLIQAIHRRASLFEADIGNVPIPSSVLRI